MSSISASVQPGPDAAGLSSAPAGAAETLRTVELPGMTLGVRSTTPARDGLPAAVFVPGMGGSTQNWSALMGELSDTVAGEAIDLPGFGESPPPDSGDYSLRGHTRAVIRYLDARGGGPVHLFGHSLGGSAVTRVAAARPDLVRSLTLVAPALPELRPQASALPTALLGVPGVARLFLRLTRDWSPERRTGEVLALCYGDPSRVTAEVFAEAVREYERKLALPYFWDAMSGSARGLVDAYTLGGQHSLWRLAQRVLAPTLLVYGGRDRLVSFRMARRARACFRESRLVTLPEAGHVLMMEYPEVVAAAVRERLRDLGSSARLTPGGEGRKAALTTAVPTEGD